MKTIDIRTMQTLDITIETLSISDMKTTIASFEAMGYVLESIRYCGYAETVTKYGGFTATVFAGSGIDVKIDSLKNKTFVARVDGKDEKLTTRLDSDDRLPEWKITVYGNKTHIYVR